MKRIWIAIAAGCLLISEAFATGTATKTPEFPTTTIVAFGDSLFAGHGLAQEDSYPALLERQLNAQGYHVTVINDGVNGDTTAGGAARVDKVIAQNPDIVLLDLGGNDLLQMLPPDQMQKNMDFILSRLQKSHVRVFILGTQAPLSMGAAYASAFNSVFAHMASMYSTGLYPSFLDGVYGQPGLMQDDGIHPTKEGVAVLVDRTLPMIRTSLKKDPSKK